MRNILREHEMAGGSLQIYSHNLPPTSSLSLPTSPLPPHRLARRKPPCPYARLPNTDHTHTTVVATNEAKEGSMHRPLLIKVLGSEQRLGCIHCKSLQVGLFAPVLQICPCIISLLLLHRLHVLVSHPDVFLERHIRNLQFLPVLWRELNHGFAAFRL